MKKKIFSTIFGVIGFFTIGHFMLLGLICLILAIIAFVEIITESNKF